VSVNLMAGSAAPFAAPAPARKHVVVVSPVYNERESVAALVAGIHQATASLPQRFSIVLVDDGSDEATARELDDAARAVADVTVVHLARNFGHQAALTAGLDVAAAGGADAAICMDSDLQHPPQLIPELVREWEAGYDVVYTIRDDAETTSAFKVLTASLFYRLLSTMSEQPTVAGAADFRLLGRPALEALTSLRERARFLRGLTSWIGFRQIAIHYTPEPRRAGESKFTLRKMVRLALDGLVSTTTLPLRLALLLGVALSAISVAYLAYVVAAYFFTNRAIHGWSSVIVAVLLLGSMNLTVLGVMGVYLARIFDEVKARPIYIVRERVGGDRDEG
jgi:dolichol-phosphate mannosyltransferase